MLSRFALMVQAAVLDCQVLDLFPPFDDGGVTPKVGVGWCDVADALVVALVVVMIDEGANLVLSAPKDGPVRLGFSMAKPRPSGRPSLP